MKLHIYLHANYVEDYLNQDYFMCFNISDRAPDGDDFVPANWSHVGFVDVEIDIDEKQIRQIAIGKIALEIAQKRAITEKEIQELEQRKQSLLVIEHQEVAE